jgi:hypothetical protein
MLKNILCRLGFHKYKFIKTNTHYGWWHNFYYNLYRCDNCSKEKEE